LAPSGPNVRVTESVGIPLVLKVYVTALLPCFHS
jgi:hypothetical protein